MLDALFQGYQKTINENVTKQVRKEMRDPTNTAMTVRFGIVTDASGQPRVQFDGEDTATNRRYPYLASYTPALNDRVALLRAGSTWLVIGKIV